MPYYGEKLDGLLRARKNQLSGIVNGIDYDIYNPETDPAMEAHYTSEDVIEKKVINKLALQKKVGLPENKEIFTIGVISRLADQKGFDLIDYVMDDICSKKCSLFYLDPETRDMKICSAIMQTNIRTQFLLTSVMMILYQK